MPDDSFWDRSKSVVSAGVGFIPFVGTGKGIVDCWNGEDAITGEEIDGWDCALNLIPIGGAALKGIGVAVDVTSAVKAANAVSDAERAEELTKGAQAAKAGNDLYKAAQGADAAADGWQFVDALETAANPPGTPTSQDLLVNAFKDILGGMDVRSPQPSKAESPAETTPLSPRESPSVDDSGAEEICAPGDGLGGGSGGGGGAGDGSGGGACFLPEGLSTSAPSESAFGISESGTPAANADVFLPPPPGDACYPPDEAEETVFHNP